MGKIYYNQLDVFRALAALSICAIHFNYNSFTHNYIANLLFVQLFFSLSGFVIFLNYYHNLTKFNNLLDFIKKRFKRLYPLHFFFLILFVILEFLKYISATKYGLEFNNKPFSTNNTYSFFSNIFFLQHLADGFTFNTPAWSISVEFWLYITFAFLLLFLKKYIILFAAIYSIIFISFFSHIYGQAHTINSYYSGLYSFFVGCLFCYLFIRRKFIIKSLFYDFFYLIILVTFLSEIFYFKLLVSKEYLYSIFFGLIFFMSCYLNKNSIIYKIVFNSFFMFLGKISYSIYLSHVFIFMVLSQFLRFVLKYPYADGQLQLSSLEANLYTLTAYAITIFFSYFSYKYIEMRFYRN
tara:strand:+ start:665 stop:1720 length:1056 start_codon:yes stop_codon:yes gene_type:complete